MPEQCPDWESEVVAHLIDGVLRIDTSPDRPSIEQVAVPSPDLATFRSAVEGLREFVRANPEPHDMRSQEHDRWSEAHTQRMQGLDSVAERILRGTAPPLDALAAIAAEYALPAGHARTDQIADGEAHDSIPDWVVKRLVHALLPSSAMQSTST